MTADTRGIRELAEAIARKLSDKFHWGNVGLTMAQGVLESELPAFAESIVEQCCKDVCAHCRDKKCRPAVYEPTAFTWWHWLGNGTSGTQCKANSIRSRWQRGEGK